MVEVSLSGKAEIVEQIKGPRKDKVDSRTETNLNAQENALQVIRSLFSSLKSSEES